MTRPTPHPACQAEGCTAPAAGHMTHAPTGARWYYCAAHLDPIAQQHSKRSPNKITRYRQPRSRTT